MLPGDLTLVLSTAHVGPEHNISRPCAPSPCGPNVQCLAYGQVAMCDPCGGPDAHFRPECRPECLANSDCPFNLACLGQRCLDPCPGSCGVSAQCAVVQHQPVCSCPPGLAGNPFEHCTAPKAPVEDVEPCERVQCGANARCRDRHGATTCECLQGFFGNAYLGCHPECVLNTDCPMDKACVSNKCENPCAGACGVTAHCSVVNHVPVCYCPEGSTGDPFTNCYPFRPAPQPPPLASQPSNPCDPSPCGPNSRCLVSAQGYATCSCLPNYRGAPPSCRPECVVSAECPQTQACVNWRCVDPCPGTCGLGARCAVINHNPICSCPPGQLGDPFASCYTPIGEHMSFFGIRC